MKRNACRSWPTRASLGWSASMLLVALSVHGLPAHAQGTFGGVRVSGIEVIADPMPRTPKVVDAVASQTSIDRQLTRQGPLVSEALRPGGGTSKPTGRPATARPRTVYSNRNLLASASLCAPLQDPRIRAAADHALRTIIAEQVNRQMGGNVVHSQSNHQLGNNCSAHAEVTGNRLTVKMSIPRNRIFLRIMNSSIFSGDLDPNFFTHYDLVATATFLMPASPGGSIVQDTLHYHVHNVDRPQSRSVTGKIAIAMNDLIAFLGGPDYIAQIRQDRNGSLGSLINLDLAEVQRALQGTAAAGTRVETTHRNGMLVLHATSRPPPQGPIVN